MVLPGLGGSEILIVALIIMVLFGAKKLPELARSLGRSKGEFEKGKADFEPESGSKSRVELEKAAKELGIDAEGKTDEELKNLIKDSL
ncbi:MAG: twin-arginine translocase TatA/TatE family subunit [Thaumarchaeota archaeon]|jgi:sec-independent protein translocase protein TatA|nr:twin-arginine translocase TatA/TatE family subunit [Nitrososphaerota archaeon]NSL75915.1 twin-arginine translocase TatA/TatE family subunit [Nitrososphaerota archaeon]NSL77663.1 twin-arginine translocase TatA/TatE family subunit [Nitrososphaerota archaeon]